MCSVQIGWAYSRAVSLRVNSKRAHCIFLSHLVCDDVLLLAPTHVLNDGEGAGVVSHGLLLGQFDILLVAVFISGNNHADFRRHVMSGNNMKSNYDLDE
jgi:hypothetical protein